MTLNDDRVDAVGLILAALDRDEEAVADILETRNAAALVAGMAALVAPILRAAYGSREGIQQALLDVLTGETDSGSGGS